MKEVIASNAVNVIVVLVCEYPIISVGLSEYISSHSDIVVAGHAVSIDQIAGIMANGSVDVALVDLAILKRSGLSSIKEIHKLDPGVKVLVISRDEREPFISKCVENGALGYVSLKCNPAELLEAIYTVNKNQKFLSKDVAYEFAMSNLSKECQQLSALTSREYQVFTMLAQGLSVVEIAEQINLSPKTIHVYRAAIMTKLNAKTNSELTVIALKNGVVSIDIVN